MSDQLEEKVEDQKEQSADWDKCNALPVPTFPGPLNKHPNYPFRVPWPEFPLGKRYELILCNGERLKSRVKLDTQYRAEGKQWSGVNRYAVMAWREL